MPSYIPKRNAWNSYRANYHIQLSLLMVFGKYPSPPFISDTSGFKITAQSIGPHSVVKY